MAAALPTIMKRPSFSMKCMATVRMMMLGQQHISGGEAFEEGKAGPARRLAMESNRRDGYRGNGESVAERKNAAARGFFLHRPT
jgi:hypothetical protein